MLLRSFLSILEKSHFRCIFVTRFCFLFQKFYILGDLFICFNGNARGSPNSDKNTVICIHHYTVNIAVFEDTHCINTVDRQMFDALCIFCINLNNAILI